MATFQIHWYHPWLWGWHDALILVAFTVTWQARLNGCWSTEGTMIRPRRQLDLRAHPRYWRESTHSQTIAMVLDVLLRYAVPYPRIHHLQYREGEIVVREWYLDQTENLVCWWSCPRLESSHAVCLTVVSKHWNMEIVILASRLSLLDCSLELMSPRTS